MSVRFSPVLRGALLAADVGHLNLLEAEGRLDGYVALRRHDARLDLLLTGGFIPTAGNIFTIVSATNITGTFKQATVVGQKTAKERAM